MNKRKNVKRVVVILVMTIIVEIGLIAMMNRVTYNSIKPISRDVEVDDEVEVRPTKDDTLEKDLFNLIDSMYEEGEEDEDNG